MSGFFVFRKVLMDDIQSTDVGSDTSAAISGESTPEAASAVSQTEEPNQTPASGNDTAQSVIEASGTEEAGTVDPTQEPDPLEGIPSLEELEQNKSQQYAQALINLRTAYEARKGELGELQGKFQPVQPLLEQHGGLETVEAQLKAYNSLFTPVVNPETQQTEIDPQSGLPRITTTPFIEQVDSENPGIAEQMLNDLLRYAPDDGKGQKVPLWQGMLKAWGLDPARLADYKNIDALAAPSTGEVTPEQLEAIDPKFHDAFKSFNELQRKDLIAADPLAREGYLQDRAEALANKAYREQDAKDKADQQQQQLAQAQDHIRKEQDSYVSSQLQEANATIMDDVARQVTFTGDPAQSSAIQCQISALLFSLRDSDYRAANAQRLESMGIKLGSDFDEALSAADKHLRDAKAYEIMGQKGLAHTSRTKATDAKNLVLAKLSPIAVKAAKASGGVMKAKANGQNQLLEGATTLRPTPGNGGTQEEVGAFGIPGMLPNDPRFGVELAKRIPGMMGR